MRIVLTKRIFLWRQRFSFKNAFFSGWALRYEFSPRGKMFILLFEAHLSHADILSGRCYVTHKTPFISYKNVNQPIFFPNNLM